MGIRSRASLNLQHAVASARALMAMLRFDLEIDSDVHPELHRMLSSMSAGAGRAERLRQLAAMGVVWEHLRKLAPSATAPARVQAAPVEPAPPSPAPVPQRIPPADPSTIPVLHDVVAGPAPPPPPPAPALAPRGGRLQRMKRQGLFGSE